MRWEDYELQLMADCIAQGVEVSIHAHPDVSYVAERYNKMIDIHHRSDASLTSMAYRMLMAMIGVYEQSTKVSYEKTKVKVNRWRRYLKNAGIKMKPYKTLKSSSIKRYKEVHSKKVTDPEFTQTILPLKKKLPEAAIEMKIFGQPFILDTLSLGQVTDCVIIAHHLNTMNNLTFKQKATSFNEWYTARTG
ncbi:MAG: hypothetical protein KAS32_23705 [Candidatus Peribacteraceae bacterium]|nr:hypothetical protein [Candidatus Peribacteraceae bacterium]